MERERGREAGSVSSQRLMGLIYINSELLLLLLAFCLCVCVWGGLRWAAIEFLASVIASVPSSLQQLLDSIKTKRCRPPCVLRDSWQDIIHAFIRNVLYFPGKSCTSENGARWRKKSTSQHLLSWWFFCLSSQKTLQCAYKWTVAISTEARLRRRKTHLQHTWPRLLLPSYLLRLASNLMVAKWACWVGGMADDLIWHQPKKKEPNPSESLTGHQEGK